jgi:hypothetical protein
MRFKPTIMKIVEYVSGFTFFSLPRWGRYPLTRRYVKQSHSTDSVRTNRRLSMGTVWTTNPATSRQSHCYAEGKGNWMVAPPSTTSV